MSALPKAFAPEEELDVTNVDALAKAVALGLAWRVRSAEKAGQRLTGRPRSSARDVRTCTY